MNLEALRELPVHMIAGKADIETWEITHREGGKYYMPGANDAGRTRIKVRFELLDNVPHNGLACVGQVQEFFADALNALREPRAVSSSA